MGGLKHTCCGNRKRVWTNEPLSGDRGSVPSLYFPHLSGEFLLAQAASLRRDGFWLCGFRECVQHLLTRRCTVITVRHTRSTCAIAAEWNKAAMVSTTATSGAFHHPRCAAAGPRDARGARGRVALRGVGGARARLRALHWTTAAAAAAVAAVVR